MDASPFPDIIATLTELRGLFRSPSSGAVDKEIYHLDDGARSFIEHSPFVAIGTRNRDGTADVSPRGGPPGFVKAIDDHRLVIGELPGNNRLDTFTNLIVDPAVGLMFLVPGSSEMLRVNGRGFISANADLIERCIIDARRPKVVLCVEVREVFLHCGKAMRRSGLWEPHAWPDLSTMTSPACIFNAAVGIDDDPEGRRTRRLLDADYEATLWHDK